jgi:hypothetical protein
MEDAMGCLVFSGCRCRRRDSSAVSRSQRRYAGTQRHGEHGPHSEPASLVRCYWLRNRSDQWPGWTGYDTTKVAAILQEGLAGLVDRSWRPADSIYGIVISELRID